MNVTILGAGAWGTALAVSVCRRHPTRLWARDAAQAAAMQSHRRNVRYLDGVVLPPALQIGADFNSAVAHARGGLLVVATPMAGLAGVLRRLPRADALNGAGLLWLCKGFEDGTDRLCHEVARALRPDIGAVGVLSGPSFAIEVARGQPTALVAASADAALRAQAVAALHSDVLRIYTSDDPTGVEVGGAVKNVLAIATGIADGMALGFNARAAMITRGLAEMARLGTALGARPETFGGLSGLGDLVLTATGDLSRNRRVGLLLADGRPLAQILAELGHVAEGVHSAPRVLRRAVEAGVEMPLTRAVVGVVDGSLSPSAALENLMARDARAEY